MSNETAPRERLRVTKTIKLFIGGEFPRTESGRTIAVPLHGTSNVYAQICRASRKDLRNAVTAAVGAQSSWEHKTPYNRAQILYRMAEMAEGKREEFNELLRATSGLEREASDTVVDDIVDAFVYYAGWADKYQQIVSNVNPVSGPHHCFTAAEPVGAVGLIAGDQVSLGSFVAALAAILASGNVVVALLPAPSSSLLAVLGEVLATSDLPKGVVNLLSGEFAELIPHFATHMELQALGLIATDKTALKTAQEGAAENMKRVVTLRGELSLDALIGFVEAKTVWHPLGY